MCTIGNAFYQNAQGIASFKQCDLIDRTRFLEPEVNQGRGDIRYLPFRRDGHKGCWSGVNSYGVSFVAADSYLQPGTNALKLKTGDIFDAYEAIVSSCRSAAEAADRMCDFYRSFADPDIVLINDPTESFYIESHSGSVVCIRRDDRFFACTNHFRALGGAVDYRSNHSTYLRLARAEALMQARPDLQGIVDVVTDQYYGETVLSICRVFNSEPPFVVPGEEAYFTQATSIFFADGKSVDCLYQINGNPRTNPFTLIRDVFGQQITTTGLSAKDIPSLAG